MRVRSERKTLQVKGWIAIRNPGSLRDAGFVLLRRGRVIIGGPERGYKPNEIFGFGNSFSSQRLIGELRLDDWPVTQAKDAFDWSGDLEDVFIQTLKKECDDYMKKAECHRVAKKVLTPEKMQKALVAAKQVFETRSFSKAITSEVKVHTLKPTTFQHEKEIKKVESISSGKSEFKLIVNREEWLFKIFWQEKILDKPWISVEYPKDKGINIYLNSSHPFFEPYLEDIKIWELLCKLAIVIALSEKLARRSSHDDMIHADDFRQRMNMLLNHASNIQEGKDGPDNRP